MEYECRYHKDDVFLDTDDVTDEMKDYIRDLLYREDLAEIFGISGIEDFDVLDKELVQLHKKIGEICTDDFRSCVRDAAAKLMSTDEVTGLCILFSYDYLYITHKCIADLLREEKMDKKDISILKILLEK